MPTYTALAIGPIYKTMSQTRKSRHLWGASYLFSFIMKKLLTCLLTDAELNLTDADILLPHRTLKELNERNYTGTGLYPDRLFVADKNKKVTDKINLYQQDIINILISATGSEYKKFLENYLRIYSVSYLVPVTPAYELSKDKNDYTNIIWVGNKLLDSLELKEKYYPDITDIKWNDLVDKLNGKKFYKDAFNKDENEDYQFPSVMEIATVEFEKENVAEYRKFVMVHRKDEDKPNAHKNFYDGLSESKAFGDLKVKPYHKYMAVVQADGDNIGKTIAAIGHDEADVKNFSRALFDFAQKASLLIDRYGGKPVYVGGDDLFFFAPVAVRLDRNLNELPGDYLRTLFDLINDIDKLFKEKVIESVKLKHIYANGVEKPSLSYGVSVVFTKYPLNEARDIAHHLLLRAKEKPDDKNKICFRVLRHSGQGFGFTVDKKRTSANPAAPESYDFFLALCGKVPDNKTVLSSLVFKLAPFHATLNSIGKDSNRVKDLFDNTFNERIHKEEPIKNFLTHARQFTNQVFIDFDYDNEGMPEYETEERNGNLAKIYSTLRFLKMLVADE